MERLTGWRNAVEFAEGDRQFTAFVGGDGTTKRVAPVVAGKTASGGIPVATLQRFPSGSMGAICAVERVGIIREIEDGRVVERPLHGVPRADDDALDRRLAASGDDLLAGPGEDCSEIISAIHFAVENSDHGLISVDDLDDELGAAHSRADDRGIYSRKLFWFAREKVGLTRLHLDWSLTGEFEERVFVEADEDTVGEQDRAAAVVSGANGVGRFVISPDSGRPPCGIGTEPVVHCSLRGIQPRHRRGVN